MGSRHYGKLHVEAFERTGGVLVRVTCGEYSAEVLHTAGREAAQGLALEKLGRLMFVGALEKRVGAIDVAGKV